MIWPARRWESLKDFFFGWFFKWNCFSFSEKDQGVGKQKRGTGHGRRQTRRTSETMSWREPWNTWPYFIIYTSPQNCDTQHLRVVTSRSNYPKKRTLHLSEDFCLIVSKMRKICKDENRKKAFEDYYADLHNNHPLLNKCNVVLSMFVSCLDPNCYSNSYPDERVAHHCPNRPGSKNNGDDTLYTPDPNEANRAAEEALEKAVAKYAEDNLVVVRVGIICPTKFRNNLLSPGFPERPLLPEVDASGDDVDNHLSRSSRRLARTLLWTLHHFCGLSSFIFSLNDDNKTFLQLEICYHGLLFVIAICKGEHVHN